MHEHESPMKELPPPSTTSRTALTAALVLVAGVVLFYELGGFRTLGSHEVYAAVPAREMLEGGDWVVPRFGGLPRLEKPPLAYWVVAASAMIVGEMNEWAVRLPAAFSGLLLSGLVGFWAFRWYGKTTGIAVAFVQVTSVWTIIFARKAEVDMLLCLLTTAALFLIVEHKRDEPFRRAFCRWIVIYALISLAWMAKFYFGAVMVLAPTVGYFVMQRRFRSLLHMANPVGLGLLAAAAFIWPHLLMQEVPNVMAVWKAETVDRAMGGMGHQPVWFYVPHILWMTLPWTPLALAGLGASWKQAWWNGPRRERLLFGIKKWKVFEIKIWKEGDARERFLWVWFLVTFIIVTVSANKHKHYVLPALPVFSLLAGRSLVVLIESMRAGRKRFGRLWATGMIVVCLSGAGMTLAIISRQWPDMLEVGIALALILGLGGCTTIVLLARQQPTKACYSALFVFLGCYIGVTGWIMPGRDHRLETVQFARDVRSLLTYQKDVGVYGMGMHSVVYYLDHPVYRMESIEAVSEQLSRRGTIHLVTLKRRAGEFEKIGHSKVIKQMTADPTEDEPRHPLLVLIELTLPERLNAAVDGSDAQTTEKTAAPDRQTQHR